MSALGRVVRAGVGRRRVQTVVIGLATAMAVTAAVLGGSLLVASRAPFDTAFADQRGAHLTAQFDAGKVTAEELAATATAAGVTAAAGPFQTVTITPRGNVPRPGGGAMSLGLPPLTVAGRAEPGGRVDAVTLTEGEWATGPGQIVLAAGDGVLSLPLGTELEVTGGATLTVVGFARSVSRTADAWVSPDQIGSLAEPGAPGGYQMLYRFSSAGTADQVTADRAVIAAAVPDGALTGAQSWLAVREQAVRTIALFVPFLVAFGVLGVVMSVLIVGNVVAGAVGAATRRIGILKAVGFTPGQVVRAYVVQALIPAAAGTAVGVVAAHLLAVPVLAETESVYGAAGLAVAWWVDAAVVAGALTVVAVSAWAGAWRAGRLRTVDAIAVGRTPRAGRGRWAARLTARLPLPRPVGLGLARPFARPARALAMVAAVGFGATAVTFAVGLATSLNEVNAARHHEGDVTVSNRGPGPMREGPPEPLTADPAAVAAAITGQSGTAAYYGVAETEATVAGVSGTTTVLTVTGDASGFYEMVEGRWFGGTGEAVAPTTFLTATGTGIGDTVTVNTDGAAVTVRIVGEIFDTRNDGMEIITAGGTPPASYHIALTPGTDPGGYADTLTAALKPLGLTASASPPDASEVLIAVTALATMLTLMLVAVAALGVLNAVVLDTRERVRDLGIHKALGMIPRQTVVMVVASVTVVGLAGGILGTPAGAALHAVVMPAMGTSAGVNLPVSATDVYHPSALVLFALGGVLIAVLGALLPAGWAARTRTATALRTE